MFKPLFSLLLACLLVLPAAAQTFQTYLEQFPLINSPKTWTDSEIAALPASNSAPLDAKFASFIGGVGYRFEYQKIYPLGKIEVGKAVIVFIAATSSTYNPESNTQIAVDAYWYNKSTGKPLGIGFEFYLWSVGGDVQTQAFMYAGKLETDGKTWLKVHQTGTGSAMKKRHAYKISSKGLSFDKEF